MAPNTQHSTAPACGTHHVMCAMTHRKAHRVSLVAVCCRDSRRSWSDCRGRMFFSSSSLFDGRLLSLMARESLRRTLMASVPVINTHARGNGHMTLEHPSLDIGFYRMSTRQSHLSNRIYAPEPGKRVSMVTILKRCVYGLLDKLSSVGERGEDQYEQLRGVLLAI